jgi:hypothetical protein
MHDRSKYIYGDFDDMDYETNLPGYGVVFPHPFGKADGKLFTTLLIVSPAGDELCLNFAKELVLKEELGKDEITDYLSIRWVWQIRSLYFLPIMVRQPFLPS